MTSDSVTAAMETFQEHYKISVELVNSRRARFTWFVAISGFGLINSIDVLGNLIDKSPEKWQLLLMGGIWILAAILALFGHIKWDEAVEKDNLHFTNRMNHFRKLKIDLDARVISKEQASERLMKISENKWRKLPELTQEVTRLVIFTQLLERLSFASIGVAILVSGWVLLSHV
jgi:hypothetical protein